MTNNLGKLVNKQSSHSFYVFTLPRYLKGQAENDTLTF